MKVQLFSAIGTPATIVIILFIAIMLYYKCFQNGNSCVCVHTRPVSLPVCNAHIESDPISNLLPEPSEQLSPQIIQEILKPSGVHFSKFQCYKCCKAKHQTASQTTKVY